MNLSVRHAPGRVAKEVGIRKTMAPPAVLANQFFSESFLVVIFAYALALLLTACSPLLVQCAFR